MAHAKYSQVMMNPDAPYWEQVTCHPYLCQGLEDDIAFRRTESVATRESERDMLVVSPHAPY